MYFVEKSYTVQVCDATKFNSYSAAGSKKFFNYTSTISIFLNPSAAGTWFHKIL